MNLLLFRNIYSSPEIFIHQPDFLVRLI